MNKLFRFLDICREGLSRRNDRLLQGTARRRPEKRYRKFLHSTVLRIEGLEERQLLAIMAGAEFPEYDAPAQTGENIYEVIIGGFDTTDAPPPAAAYEVVATNIAQINAYFADEAYVPVKTKDYILYFSGGVNPDNNGYRYYANMVDFYCTVTTELGIVPENIFILYADGTDPAVDREDGFNSDMSFATVHGTNVYSATMANLTEAMDIISSQMDEESHFLFFAYDHGSGVTPNDDPAGYAVDYNDYLCGWSGNRSEFLLGADVARQLFKIREGYITCLFSECFSGGILDDIFTVSTDEPNESYHGNAHFYGAAATNHYEQSWTGWDETGVYYGAAQGFTAAMSADGGGLLNTNECYEYMIAHNSFVAVEEIYNKNEGEYTGETTHPWEIGESFDIFGFVPSEIPDPTVTYLVTTLDDTVDPDDGETSLREAILNANEVARVSAVEVVITFADDLAGGVIKLANGQLELSVPMVIDASSLGVKGITVDASGNSRVFYITYGTEEKPVILIDLTITGGFDSLGGGIYNTGFLRLDNCLITQNIAQLDGGGIYNTGRLTMTDTLLRANVASVSAGALYSSGTVAAERVSFLNNTVEGSDTQRFGGAIFNRNGALALVDVKMEANRAGSGAALASFHGTVSLSSSGFENTGNTGITNLVLDNHSEETAAIYVEGGSLYLEGVGISGNVASEGCGAVFAGNSEVTVLNASIVRNTGVLGGGFCLSGGTFAAANTQISRNFSAGEGGGLWILGTNNVSLVNMTVAGNSTGVWSDSDLYIANSIIALNSSNDLTLGLGTKTVAYAVLSSFDAWSVGEGNIVYDDSLPLFTNAGLGECLLVAGSQALDVGRNDLALYPSGREIAHDPKGGTRFSNAIVDLGADEYQVVTAPSLVVTTPLDRVDPYDGEISLREAVRYAAAYADILGTTITFAPSLAGQTITLDATLGAIEISSSMTIDASALRNVETQAPGITVDAAASVDDLRRVFEITAGNIGIDVVIRGIEITGGYWHGGDLEASGAGVYAVGVNLSLIDSYITENFATGYNVSGAGLFLVDGTLILKGTLVSGNAASGYYTYGGGVYVSGSYVIEDSSIVENVSYASGSDHDSYAYGGGLYAAGGSIGYIANTVISGNSAGYTSLDSESKFSFDDTFYAYGGGLYIQSDTLTIVNTTVAGNAASAGYTGFGGGIFYANPGGEYNLYNSIVMKNFASIYGEDIYTQTIGLNGESQSITARSTISGFTNWYNADTGEYYLYDPARTLFAENPEFENGILVNSDTYNLTLLHDSQVVNRGNNDLLYYVDGSTIELDVAGNPRLYNGGRVDLGAYEYQASYVEPFSLVVTILDDTVDPTDGEVSLREAILYAAQLGADSTITFDASLAGETILVDTEQGELVISSSLTIDANSLGIEENVPALTIDAQTYTRVFRITSDAKDVMISGVEIVNGSSAGSGNVYGGGIYAENTGTLTLANGSISGCTVLGDYTYGGAVYVASNLSLVSFNVNSNSANASVNAYGGGVYVGGTVDLSASQVQGNVLSAYNDMYGGGIYARGEVTLDDGSSADGNELRSNLCSVLLLADQNILASGVTLTAYPTPDDLTLTYQWYRGTIPTDMDLIEGAESDEYMLTNEDAGCYVMVAVTPEGGSTVSAISETPVFGVSLSNIVPGVGQTLTAKATPAEVEVAYRWYRVDAWGETLIDGAQDPSYTVTSEDIGYNLKVAVVGTGDYEGYTVYASTETIADFSVTLSNAKPQLGETLSTTLAPSGASVTYQWYRVVGSEEVAIEGAVDSIYTVTSDDAGYGLKVTVSGTGTYSGQIASAQTDIAVFGIELSNTAPRVGEVLSVNLLPSDAEALFIWYRGHDLSNMTSTGQFGSVYAVTQADKGCYIRVVAIGSGEHTGCFASTSTEAPLAEYSLVLDDLNPEIGETVTAILSPEDSTVAFRWYRLKNGAEIAIEGATDASYTVTMADAGAVLKVVAFGVEGYEGQQTYARTGSIDPPQVALSNADPAYGETLSVSWTPEAMTADVQWYRSIDLFTTEEIDGATDMAYVLTFNDVGYYIGAKITGIGDYEGFVCTTWTWSEVSSPNLEITLNPTVPTVGSVITASMNLDIDAEWQWYRVDSRGEMAILNARSAEYIVTSGDIGCYLRVKASGTGEYASLVGEAQTSRAVAVLSVSLSDDQPQVGQTLTANLAPVSAEALYQWYRGSDPRHMSPILGASGSTYTVTSEDIGAYLRVVAIGTGAYTGYFAMATTSGVAVLAAPLPAGDALPTGTNFPEGSAFGAGIYSLSSVTLNGKSTADNNKVTGVCNLYGVGISSGNQVTLTDGSSVAGNNGEFLLIARGGGVYAKSVLIDRSSVSNNSLTVEVTDDVVGDDFLPTDPSLYGGGVYASGDVTVVAGQVRGNTLGANVNIVNPDYACYYPTASGGGIYSRKLTSVKRYSEISENKISVTGHSELDGGYTYGAGIYSSSLTLSQSQVRNNSINTTRGVGFEGNGAGVYILSGYGAIGTFTMADSQINDNKLVSGQGTGGGIFVGSGVEISIDSENPWLRCVANEIVGNSIDVLNDAYGAGMNIAGTGEIRGITISGNTAKSSASSVFGAGIFSYNTLKIFSAKIIDNTSEGLAGQGGGLYSRGELTMVNTLITKNTAKEIANVLFGNTATIVNCTIVGNGTSLSFSTDSNVYNSIILTDVESGGSANAYNTVSTFTDWANKPADEGGDEGDEGDGGGGEGGEGAALPMATGAEGPDDNGNILYQDGDSLFLGEGNDPYSLASDSIAINAGEISYYASYGGEAGNYDIVGMPRIADSIDCGAYEYYETPDIVTNPLYIVVTTESDVVDPTDGEISLREAILYATNGSTITFVDEVVSITLDGNLPQIEINKDLTIVDPDVTITGVSNRRVFAIYGNPDEGNISVSFSGLNITGGAGLSAENVDLELTNVDITGNSLDSGGSGAGIFASNSALTLTDVNITNNRISGGSGSGAGIYAKSSALDFNNVKINGNTVIDSNSTVYGAGIFLDSSELIMRGSGSDISGNSLEGYTAYGGAIYSIASIVELSGVKITDNSASADVGSSSAYGGGIYISDTSSLAMNDCTLHGNRLTGYGTYGNALYSENSEVIGSYTTVRDNTASATYSAYGGGFYLSASNVFLTNMQIGCEKQGVYNNYSIKIPGNSLSVSDSSGRVYGGAIYATANSPEAYDLVIHDSLIEGNEGVAGSDFGIGEGGAIWLNNGILRVYNTQISQNSVTAGSTRGGGIYLANGYLTLVHCTVAFNSAASPYGCRYSYGGGIFVSPHGGNRPEGTLAVYNTIVAVNYALSGANVSCGDITETQADLDFGQNNIIDFNPYFLETAFFDRYGTITNPEQVGTYASVTPESRAINTGNGAYTFYEDGSPINFSLTGAPRIYRGDGYGVVDIGACEYQDIPKSVAHPSGVVTSLEDIIDPTDGVWTLREAIYYAVEDTKIEFEPQLAHGYIVLNDTLYIDKPVEIDFSGITLNASHSFGALVVAESATLSNLNIRYGSAIYGSGIYATDLRLINGTISDSDGDRTRESYGGAIYSIGRLELYETDIVNCYAFYGGAVYAEHGETKYGATASGDSGILILEDGTVSGCSALIGGAFYLNDATTLINRGVIDSNMAIGAGFKFTYAGAVYISSRGGKTVINDSYIVNNVADYVVGDVYSVGGGIYTEARAGLWLTNSVLSGNSALDGGALYSYNLANVNILNSTIAGNTAVYGGGIYGFGTINLTNSVVALNRANTAGNDVYRGPGSLNVYLRSEIYAHNILSSYSKWDNFAEPDCHGYVYDSSRPLFVVDPKFNSLGQLINGNIVDLMLTAGSQALDLGLLDSETHSVLYPDVVPNIFDLAGKSIPYALNGNDPSSAKVFRVIGPSVDLGAYEYTVVPASTAGPYVNEEGVVVTTLDDVVDYSDGKISLREAIQIAGTQFENLKVGSKITFDPSLASNEELVIHLNAEFGTLVISKSLTIDATNLWAKDGPLLTINADGSEENRLRVLEILGEGPTDEADAVYITVDLIGLEITGGYLADRIAEEDAEAILPVGAGIFARYANLTLVDCAIAENTILSEERVAGAGLYAEYSQTLTIRRTEVAENSAEGEIVCGAGASLFHCQSIVITDSVFAQNEGAASIDVCGTGLAITGGVLQAANSLFVLNSAMGTVRSLGGGLFATGSVQLTNITVGGNTAAQASENVGGGVYVTGEFSAVNTIISGNNAEENRNLYAISPEGTNNLIDGRENLIFHIPALFDAMGQITNADAADFDLAKGAPAIDAGDTGMALYPDGTPLTVDVVGNRRVQGEAVDIGAYEYSRIDLVVTTLADGYDWSDGFLSLREAIYLAGTTSGSFINESTITFDTSLRGGMINVDPVYGEFVIDKDLVIDASSLCDSGHATIGITISGAGQSRVFKIAGAVGEDPITVELLALCVTDGYVNGGLNDAFGGGLFVSNADLTLTDVKIHNNSLLSQSRAYGGGLCLTDAALQIVRAEIYGNTATGKSGSFGGGLYLALDAKTVAIRDSYLTANQAAISSSGKVGAGGALYTASPSWVHVANTQITGNMATDGAGIASFDAANITLTNVTVAGNTANYGGGIFAFGSVGLYNTIVARNTALADSGTTDVCRSGGTIDLYAESVYSANRVLSSYSHWDFVFQENYVDNTDLPLFEVLTTGEYTLADYSQAIDCGDNNAARYADGSSIKYDLAGNPRIEGDVVDLGAFEYVNYGVSICVDTAEDVINASDGLTSLREAIATATELDTVCRIYFADELAGHTISLENELEITASMVIDGADSGITVSGQGENRVFVIEGTSAKTINVVLSGLTVADGYVASDTQSSYGAGIRAEFVNLSLRNCTVTRNTATHTSGITYVFAYGAGLYASGGTVTISGSTFADNTATDGGGAIYVSESIVITDSIVTDNTVTGSYACGGGIYFSTGSMVMTDVIVSGNIASHEDFTKGGGIYLDGGDVVISDSKFTDNTAAAGGGIYSFYNNSVTISGTEITSNTAGNSVEGNGFGGGIYSWGDALSIRDTLIQGNSSYGKKSLGAGMYITYDTTVSVVNTAIVDNVASVAVNSEDAASGGGIYVYYSTMTLTCVTIAGNMADSGAGLYAYGLSSSKPTNIALRNIIAAQNADSFGSAADIAVKNAAYVTFSGSNVLSGYDGWINVDNAHTYQTAKPLFADPPAGDYSLAEGSQAINQGNNRYIFYDDGTEIVYDLSSGTRVVSRIVDLGAYEYQAESPNVPDAPKGLSVSSYGANRHRLDWLEVPGATSYVAEWSTDQLTWIEVFSNATSVVISGLDYGARVYYRVKAQADGHIDSDYSDKVAQIVCPMDIDGDGDISNGDRALLFSAWLTDDTDENWDPRCDINGDSDVTGADRALLSLNWLKEAGDDDLIYPAPLAESVLSDAAFDSVSLDDNFLKVDLDIF